MRLKFILIDDYFSQVENKELSHLMTDLFYMKKQCYYNKHKHIYLPLAQDDLYGTHGVFLDEDSQEIVMTFKVTKLSSARKYNVDFVLNNYLKEANDFDAHKMQMYVDGHIKSGHDISYSGGWAINPKFKGKGYSNYLKELYTGIHYHVHRQFNLKAITGIGVTNFQTDKFFKEVWGLKELSGEAYRFKTCPYIECKFIYSDINKLSQSKLDLADHFKDIWDNRIEYIEEDLSLDKAA